MSRRIAFCFAFFTLVILVPVIFVCLKISAQQNALQENRLVAHEWGTLTSVVDESGSAFVWRPLFTPSDLPGFVYGLGGSANRVGSRNNPDVKGVFSAKVRMETPVIYFYADRETTASVR